MSNILVVATGRKTRGGVTSVIKAHETGRQWKEYNCYWVQTHIDGNTFRKMWYYATGIVDFALRVPFYDIIHFHISQSNSAIRKKPLMRMAKILGKKTIVHFHAFNIESTICGSHRDTYEYLFRNADSVIVLSRWWEEMVKQHIFPGPYECMRDKVHIIYNPCPVIERKSNLTQRVILYAGTVNARKGYSDMIRAFAKIAKDHPEWNIVFAGNGEIEEGKKLAKELAISNQTVFLGWVSGEAKEDAFQRSAIFCLPSYAEGFPMAVLDAWAYGIPVITTPVGGIPDVAKDEENMLLFNPGDVETLARQMDKLISSYEGNQELYNRIKEASIDFADHTFNVETINKQIGCLYENLSKNP